MFLKRVLSISISLLIVLSIFGCSDDDNPSGTGGGGGTTASGVFAEFVAGRTIYTGKITLAVDAYTARLDSSYAPCTPIQPIGGAVITCNDSTLTWVPQGSQYITTGMSLVAPGASYIFTVAPGGSILALVDTIVFPTLQPQITAPLQDDTLSPTADINVAWSGFGSGTVDIIITNNAGDSIYFVQTANDGSHVIPHTELSNPSGECTLMLSYYNRKTISATGYDPRSFIAARVMHPLAITFQ